LKAKEFDKKFDDNNKDIIDDLKLSTVSRIRCNTALLAENGRNRINETLFLSSIPGMSESILDGMDTDLGDCDENLD